jgi:hypothetical protein
MPATPPHPGYVVFRKVGDDLWQLLGEVPRRPGLPARKSRIQAVDEITGGAAQDDEVYRVVLRSEWNISADDRA